MTRLGKLRAWTTNTLLVLVSLTLVLGLTEIAFRALDIRGYYKHRTRDWGHALLPEEERVSGVFQQFKPYSEFELNYDSNPTGYFNEKNGLVYKVNNLGFRDTDDYTEEKAAGVYRIIVLGDSYTFGEGVKMEDRFTEGMERRLRDQTGREIEVLSFGVGGWNTIDEIAYLKHVALEFNPDLVLVAFVLNDAEQAGNLAIWTRFRRKYENPKLKRYHLLSYVYAAVMRRVESRAYVSELVEEALAEDDKWQRAFDALGEGMNMVTEADAKYGVVVFPFMFDFTDKNPMLPIHELIREACIERGVPVLDLFDAYRGKPYMSLWAHPSDQHPNAEGHEIAAAAICDFLIAESML